MLLSYDWKLYCFFPSRSLKHTKPKLGENKDQIDLVIHPIDQTEENDSVSLSGPQKKCPPNSEQVAKIDPKKLHPKWRWSTVSLKPQPLTQAWASLWKTTRLNNLTLAGIQLQRRYKINKDTFKGAILCEINYVNIT